MQGHSSSVWGLFGRQAGLLIMQKNLFEEPGPKPRRSCLSEIIAHIPPPFKVCV